MKRQNTELRFRVVFMEDLDRWVFGPPHQSWLFGPTSRAWAPKKEKAGIRGYFLEENPGATGRALGFRLAKETTLE